MIENLDMIYLFEEGQMVESGNYSEMMAEIRTSCLCKQDLLQDLEKFEENTHLIE